MANVTFQSSVPATPPVGTIVETIDQGAGVLRQRVSIGDGTVNVSSGTVTLSSNPTVIPSSVFTVSLQGIPAVALSTTVTNAVAISSGTVTPSSAVQVTLTSNTVALSSVATVTPSSNFTVILSSNPTITSVSSGAFSIINGANTANVIAGSSTVTSTMSALVVALSTLGNLTFSVTGSSLTSILGGSAAQNTASVLAGSSTITSTMAGLVTVLSPNSAGIINTGTQAAPSSSYLSVISAGDIAAATADSTGSNPVKIGGIYNSTNPTSVSSGQRVMAWFDKSGKMIVNSALRSLKGVQLTAISCSATETNITPSSTGGNFIDIYGLVLSNLSTTSVQQVTIKDSSGGTSRLIFEVPLSDTRGFMVPVDAAVPQATSSQSWTATLSNSSGPFQITALYVTNV